MESSTAEKKRCPAVYSTSFLFLLFAILLDFLKILIFKFEFLNLNICTELSFISFLKNSASSRAVNSSDSVTEHRQCPHVYSVGIYFESHLQHLFSDTFLVLRRPSVHFAMLNIIFQYHFLSLHYSLLILPFASLRSKLLKQDLKLI
jgi:hypothetical protein